MRRIAMICAAMALLIAAPGVASVSVTARVDLSSQRMHVCVNGVLAYSWPVSTGRGRYHTPTGVYRPYLLKRRHYSSRYHGSPMPYSVFFHRGYAIHGTYATRYLGRRASHGCIRLHPRNAATLYRLIRAYGRASTRIVIRY